MQIKCFLRYNDIIQTSLMYTMLRIQYEYTQKQCVGVAIEGMDIWYIGIMPSKNSPCEHLVRQLDCVYCLLY